MNKEVSFGERLYWWSLHHGFLNFIPDKIYLKWRFRKKMGYRLDLKKPKTFNEKLQWLKLHDQNPEYTKMVDKYEAKKYVADIIGEEYIIPTLGVWNHFDEIDFDKLPNQFVLKCTHDSGGLVICKDKSKLNIAEAREKIENSLSKNYYFQSREWPYKNVKPRIIAEKYLENSECGELTDYKLMCFNGKVKCSYVANERFSETGLKITFYDRKWKKMPFGQQQYPCYKKEIKKPAKYEKMVELSEKLSQNIPFLRVDFYEVNGTVYFGELTFFPTGGMISFNPVEWDYKLGELLKLPMEEKMQ